MYVIVIFIQEKRARILKNTKEKSTRYNYKRNFIFVSPLILKNYLLRKYESEIWQWQQKLKRKAATLYFVDFNVYLL